MNIKEFKKSELAQEERIARELERLEEIEYGLKELIHGLLMGLILGFILAIIILK
ncbi:hypothetical protein ACFL0W_01675 [Nanoarchaeota archaeon]